MPSRRVRFIALVTLAGVIAALLGQLRGRDSGQPPHGADAARQDRGAANAPTLESATLDGVERAQQPRPDPTAITVGPSQPHIGPGSGNGCRITCIDVETGMPVRGLRLVADVRESGRPSEAAYTTDDAGSVLLPSRQELRVDPNTPWDGVLANPFRNPDLPGASEARGQIMWCWRTCTIHGRVTFDPPRESEPTARVGWVRVGQEPASDGSRTTSHLGTAWLAGNGLDRSSRSLDVKHAEDFVLRVPRAAGVFVSGQAGQHVPVLLSVPDEDVWRDVEVVLRRAPIVTVRAETEIGQPIPGIEVLAYTFESLAEITPVVRARVRIGGGGMTGSPGAAGTLQQHQRLTTDAGGEVRAAIRNDGEVTLCIWSPGYRTTTLHVGRVSRDATLHVTVPSAGPGEDVLLQRGGAVLLGCELIISDVTREPQISFTRVLGKDGKLPGGLLLEGHRYFVMETGGSGHPPFHRWLLYGGERVIDIDALPASNPFAR
jgi:hypothetical protein